MPGVKHMAGDWTGYHRLRTAAVAGRPHRTIDTWDALAKINNSEEELENCVDDGVVGRHASNIDIEE